MAQETLIARTCKIRRGDVIVEQVADTDRPYREVVINRIETAEIAYAGRWHEVKYLTGTDGRTGREVRYTAPEHRMWQLIRER